MHLERALENSDFSRNILVPDDVAAATDIQLCEKKMKKDVDDVDGGPSFIW